MFVDSKEPYTLCTSQTACVYVLDTKLCLSILVVLTVLPVAIPVVKIFIYPFQYISDEDVVFV